MQLYPTKYGPVVLKRGIKSFISAPFLSVLREILRTAGVDVGKCQTQKDGPLEFTVVVDEKEIEKVKKALEKPEEAVQKPFSPNRRQVIKETIRRSFEGEAGAVQIA
ncbi:MAG TPA: hypothetical protein VMZ27_05410 [Candidatus Saccharimonadales bacterium]|nr:hypothetical protein [Candidatus Saccharimonadales bacterium]